MVQATDRNAATALLILRFFLGIFLLQWSLEKLLVPSATIRIAQGFYGVSLPVAASYALGIAELALSLALLLGAFRTISYGLALIVHTITVVVSWRQLFDPYGFAQVGNHLWISTWPTWGAFIALYLLRKRDAYSIDGWRESHAPSPG
jgi:putative oxidoreductase